MKRPLAYITAAWRGDPCEVTEQAADYCRSVYEAGFSPICPTLYLPLFLHDAVPQEHKDSTDMARDLLRRSRVLGVCGGRGLGAGLLLGGGLSNLWERIRHGRVLDYLRFPKAPGPLKKYTYNLADLAIFLGAVLMVLRRRRQ